MNADEGMLFWVGKGGERKVVQLKHVQKIEAADGEGENVMVDAKLCRVYLINHPPVDTLVQVISSSPTFSKRGTPDNAHRYFTLFISSEGGRSTLDLEAPTPMQRDMLIQILTEAL